MAGTDRVMAAPRGHQGAQCNPKPRADQFRSSTEYAVAERHGVATRDKVYCGAQSRSETADVGPGDSRRLAQAVLRAMAFSSRSIRSCTRRIARSSIFVSVLPALVWSPIRNCHCQTPGIAVFATVNSTPL